MENPAWWQRAVIYQIYPRSFYDADGDGIGDLKGIFQKLPYLADLGVDAIWLSPVFKSPMVDFGYDISDHCTIDPLFGTMADFDATLDEAHRLGLKLILDLVPNHTSSEHPWFVDSRSSRSAAFRDWYIWLDPAPDGGPPNNWLSVFGGSGWEFDEATGQYYYHTFLSCQPDLNWRNPKVRNAIKDVMRFWLVKGVDGFRMDALWYLLKDDQFRDNPINPDYREVNLPNIASFRSTPPTCRRCMMPSRIYGERRDEFDDRLLIGEIYLPPTKLVAYYGRNLEGVHLPFNFSLLETQWHARTLALLIEEYEGALPSGSWPNWVLGNHDRPRIASQVGDAQRAHAAPELRLRSLAQLPGCQLDVTQMWGLLQLYRQSQVFGSVTLTDIAERLRVPCEVIETDVRRSGRQGSRATHRRPTLAHPAGVEQVDAISALIVGRIVDKLADVAVIRGPARSSAGGGRAGADRASDAGAAGLDGRTADDLVSPRAETQN